MITGYASGKVILFGEHAVVYGRPAIAVPLAQVRAEASIQPAAPGTGTVLRALDLVLEQRLDRIGGPQDPLHGLAAIIHSALEWLEIDPCPDIAISLSSTIPIASGLGSGAAVSTAIVRALAQYAGVVPEPAEVSRLVYQAEMIYHGTPSGIDNTVIAYDRPVYFVKGRPIELLDVARPFWLAVGNTGIGSPTRTVVAEVRRRWEQNREGYEARFDHIAKIVADARVALAEGRLQTLASLMNENQQVLDAIGVSSPELDKLVAAARRAGALGAKLCGAGRGCNMVALCPEERSEAIATAMQEAGAAGVIVSQVAASR